MPVTGVATVAIFNAHQLLHLRWNGEKIALLARVAQKVQSLNTHGHTIHSAGRIGVDFLDSTTLTSALNRDTSGTFFTSVGSMAWAIGKVFPLHASAKCGCMLEIY